MTHQTDTSETHEKMDSALDSVRTPLWGLFIIAILAILYLGQSIFIPVFLAIIVALTLSPMVIFFTKCKIPRSLGAGLVLIIVSTIFGTGISYLSEPAGIWFERLPAEVRQLERKVSGYTKSMKDVQKTKETINKITEIKDGSTVKKQEVVVKKSETIFTLLDSTQAVITGALIFLVLLYFFLAYGDNLTVQLGRYWFHKGYQTNLLRVSQEAQETVGKYLLYITIINICLGTSVGFALWLLDMPNPMVWGASTAILNFIPYVGPAINIALITLVSLLTFDNSLAIILPPLILLGFNIIEGQFIQPMVVGHMLTINPILVFMFILFWGWLWGVAGLFMAVPILVVIKIIINQDINENNKNSASSLSSNLSSPSNQAT